MQIEYPCRGILAHERYAHVGTGFRSSTVGGQESSLGGGVAGYANKHRPFLRDWREGWRGGTGYVNCTRRSERREECCVRK